MESAKRKNLTNSQRQAIYEILLKQSVDGKLKYGTSVKVAAQFSVTSRTVRRIWLQAKEGMIDGSLVDVSHKKTGRVGRKRVEIDTNMISAIPLRQRTCIRSMAAAANMAKSTLHKRVKEGAIRPHSNAVKPTLTDANKIARLRFALSMLEDYGFPSKPMFKSMYNHVHIDKKWFYLTKESQKYYLLPEEDETLRSCQSKRFITKVMFMVVVARPRYDFNNNEIFSGKIGMFPFTFEEDAKHKSKNRNAGTLETKAILSVNKDVIRSCLINKVFPAIRSAWPRGSDTETIYIQQDNARPHINPDDAEFIEAATKEGFDIRLSFQPPNNQDFNVLALGYFRAIQLLQYREAPNSIDELVQAVDNSFKNLASQSLDYIFLTFQKCMIESMKVLGSNNYKVPHMGKARLARNGNLPIRIECDTELIENVRNYINQH